VKKGARDDEKYLREGKKNKQKSKQQTNNHTDTLTLVYYSTRTSESTIARNGVSPQIFTGAILKFPKIKSPKEEENP